MILEKISSLTLFFICKNMQLVIFISKIIPKYPDQINQAQLVLVSTENKSKVRRMKTKWLLSRGQRTLILHRKWRLAVGWLKSRHTRCDSSQKPCEVQVFVIENTKKHPQNLKQTYCSYSGVYSYHMFYIFIIFLCQFIHFSDEFFTSTSVDDISYNV